MLKEVNPCDPKYISPHPWLEWYKTALHKFGLKPPSGATVLVGETGVEFRLFAHKGSRWSWGRPRSYTADCPTCPLYINRDITEQNLPNLEVAMGRRRILKSHRGICMFDFTGTPAWGPRFLSPGELPSCPLDNSERKRHSELRKVKDFL